MTEVPAVWVCQRIHVKPNCRKFLFKSFPASPSHILKLSPDLHCWTLRPPGPLGYQTVFWKEKCISGTFHTQRQNCGKQTLRKFMILCSFWNPGWILSGGNFVFILVDSLFQHKIWVIRIFFLGGISKSESWINVPKPCQPIYLFLKQLQLRACNKNNTLSVDSVCLQFLSVFSRSVENVSAITGQLLWQSHTVFICSLMLPVTSR